MAAGRLYGSLKINRHLRGHIADCNGSLEAVGACVEPCREYSHSNNAQLSALMEENQIYQKLRLQSQQAEVFEKSVKERIKKRMKENSLDSLMSCPAPNITVERHVENVPDSQESTIVSDIYSKVRVTRGRNDRQRAYQKLLSVSEFKKCPAPADNNESTSSSTLDPVEQYNDNGMKVMKTWESVPENLKLTGKKTLNFLPPDLVKIEQKKETAAQQLAVRRMYSAIERQQSRVNAEHRQMQSRVDRLRDKREHQRRLVEEEDDEERSCLSEDDEEREQWLEMIALERRRQKLVKEKEKDRYFQALHHQMKEKLPGLPALCPCHPSLWASDPNFCARNCQFYRNHSKFASAVQSLLKSVT